MPNAPSKTRTLQLASGPAAIRCSDRMCGACPDMVKRDGAAWCRLFSTRPEPSPRNGAPKRLAACVRAEAAAHG